VRARRSRGTALMMAGRGAPVPTLPFPTVSPPVPVAAGPSDYNPGMHHREIRSVAAGADVVWELLADVSQWPSLTRSMQSVELDGPLMVGAVVTIKQPRLPTTPWEVTAVEPGRSFTWEARAPGLLTVARHEVEPAAAGTSLLTLTLDQRGPLARPVALAFGRLTKRYVAMEADGLAAAATRL